MKKHLRYLLTLLLVMVASVGWADEETITFKDRYSQNTIVDGTAIQGTNCTLLFNKRSGGTATQYYTNGSAVRWYGGGTLKVSSEKTIIKIEIVFTQTANSVSADKGTYDSGTWTGSENEVNFTQSGTSGHCRISSITITYDDGTSTAVTTAVTIDNTGITNKDLFAGTAAGQLTATVKDDEDTAIEGATVTWTSSKENVATIAADGTVTLVAEGTTTLTASYAGVEDVYKSSSATYELTVTNSDPDKPGSENNPYTVAEALANTPAAGTITPEVYVRGIVSRFQNTTIMDDGDNFRYYISDDGTTTSEIQVYRGKGLNNVAFANDDDLLIGDEVVIKGGLTTYKSTKEIAENNYIVSLNRNTSKVAMPTFSPAAGTYSEVQNVEITTATDGATIYYTTDGTDPDATSTEYTAAIPVAQTMTIKAIAVKEGMTDSEIATAEYIIKIITVNPKNIRSNYFVKVTDAANLEDGDAILIVNEEYKKAMGADRGNNREAVQFELKGNAIMPESGVQKLVLTSAGDAKWMFCVGTSVADGFLTSGTSTGNNLKKTTKPDDNANATIAITEDGNAAIIFQGTGSRKTVRYNSTNGSNLFSCYTSGQQDVQIYKEVERTSVNVTIGETGYATLYYSDVNLTVPEGVTAKTYKANGTALVELDNYSAGDVIPAGTGVVLNGAKGDYTFAISAESGTASEENMLRGSDEAAETTGGAKYYMLSLAATGGNETVGFYYGAENGAAFTNKAHRAYLAVPEGTEAKATGYAFNEVTGINDITREQVTDGVWYTIDGKRLNGEPTVKGIYVVSGKKVVKK